MTKRDKFHALRRFIKEEVYRSVMRSAGFGGGAGIAGRGRGSAEIDPICLGDSTQFTEEETREEYGQEQEKSQFTARVDKERGTSR